jgi:acetyl/propionyl-CoA carboxylase alpha subunit
MAKLIVWGRDRGEAIRRMAGALAEFGVAGVRTTIPFHLAVVRDPDFVAGRLSTAFVERRSATAAPRPDPMRRRAVLVAAALHAARRAEQARPALVTAEPSPWAQAGRPGLRRGSW